MTAGAEQNSPSPQDVFERYRTRLYEPEVRVVVRLQELMRMVLLLPVTMTWGEGMRAGWCSSGQQPEPF